MQLGWIDFSKEDRQKAVDVINLLSEQGAVDELGIGVIRDAFANYFFPGTSTIQTIADTYPDFKKRINGADRKSDGCRIRSSYAVGFTKDAGDNSKVVMRKENIRNAFNSPMRPFVLATTSIGQEGLDFHNYCRVIMHWNLPSNPIDVGRILRTFKIKKNVEVTDNGKIII